MSNVNLTTTERFSSDVVCQYRAIVCENTSESGRLLTNYSLVKVRINAFLGCVKPERMAWVEFVILVVQSYFDLLLRY